MGKFYPEILFIFILSLCNITVIAQTQHVCNNATVKYSMYGYKASSVIWYLDANNVLQNQIISDAANVHPTDLTYFENTFVYKWINTGKYILNMQEINSSCSSDIIKLNVIVHNKPKITSVDIVQDICDTNKPISASIKLAQISPLDLNTLYVLKDKIGNEIIPAQTSNTFTNIKPGEYSVEVFYTFTDINNYLTKVNNSSVEYEFTINNIVDIEDPIAICKNVTISLNNNASVNVKASEVNNGSTDNCGIESMQLSKTVFSCEDIYAEQTVILDAGLPDDKLSIKIFPYEINTPDNTCDTGYNYSVSLAYEISFVGNNFPDIKTINASIELDNQTLNFSLPTKISKGTIISSSVFTNRKNCASPKLSDFTGGDINIEITRLNTIKKSLKVTRNPSVEFTITDKAGNTQSCKSKINIINNNIPVIDNITHLDKYECALNEIERYNVFTDLALLAENYTLTCSNKAIVQYRIQLPDNTFVNDFGSPALNTISSSDPSGFKFPLGISKVFYRLISYSGKLSNTEFVKINIYQKPNPSFITTDN